MRKALWAMALAVAVALPMAALAQQPTTGTLQGIVADRDGKPIAGATITLMGQTTRSLQTGGDGTFNVPFLPVGSYRVRVEAAGFSTIEIPNIPVSAGQRTALPITLLPGQAETVTVTGAAPLIDVKRTEVVTSFKTKGTIENLPVGRNFTDVVQFAPGVVSGIGTGAGNYSIGGSSGLENSYIIDGVNITDSGFGGVGSYNRNFNALGTGVTTDFLEEVQIKTAGFEAEYGQALGGVVTGVVKSGTNDFSGSLKAYYTGAEAEGKDVVLIGGATNIDDRKIRDTSVHAGGPIVKDKLFWFASYNPIATRQTLFRPEEPIPNPIVAVDPGTLDTGATPSLTATYTNAVLQPPILAAGLDATAQTDNYAAKFNWYATPNHRFELTAFGDPSTGTGGLGTASAYAYNLHGDLNADGIVDFVRRGAGTLEGGLRSDLEYGADQQSVKYTGVFGGDWLLEAQINHRKNEITEDTLVNDHIFRDVRALLFHNADPAFEAVNIYNGGFGALFPSTDETFEYSAKVSKTWGDHEVKFGATYWDLEYEEGVRRSGPSTTLNFPRLGGGAPIQVTTNSGLSVQVRGGVPGCTLCPQSSEAPVYRAVRGNFNPIEPVTGEETSFFAQDTWSISDNWTLKFGVRAVRQKMTGSGRFTLNLTRVSGTAFTDEPQEYIPNSYTFKTEWSPRVGLIFDPRGDGRSKVFGNYARYFERIPADLAVRGFSNEVGTSNYEARDPDFTVWRGSAINLQGLSPTSIEPDTRLPYVDEFVLGWQQLIGNDISVEVRGIYRDQGRVLEDVQYTSVEDIENYYYYDPDGDEVAAPPLFPYAVNPAPFGSYVLANPGNNTPKDVQFPFTVPERKYKALEFILNKQLANNWMFQANYRYARLRGNYEGLYRNDNTQEDPNLTSLFDFPPSPVMRGQFDPGPLNTDRTNVLNLMATYFFDFGLEIGGILSWQSGSPRTPLLAHPNYQNSGEIPGIDPIYLVHDDENDVYVEVPGSCSLPGGGDSSLCLLGDYAEAPRGSLGRTPDIATLDLHLGYAKKIKNSNLKFTLDVTNLFNEQQANGFQDTIETTAAVLDPNFGRINGYQRPRIVRVGAIWDF